MGPAERRAEIMRALCRKRHETISNLAYEFSVCERTIMRDIEVLSLFEPIYTQRGKYGGGVYVLDNYTMTRMYMTEEEIALLEKIANYMGAPDINDFDNEERILFNNIISQYKKPTYRKETINEKAGKRTT